MTARYSLSEDEELARRLQRMEDEQSARRQPRTVAIDDENDRKPAARARPTGPRDQAAPVVVSQPTRRGRSFTTEEQPTHRRNDSDVLEYARRLQEQAFNQHNTTKSKPPSALSSSSGRARSTTPSSGLSLPQSQSQEESELALALEMSALEQEDDDIDSQSSLHNPWNQYNQKSTKGRAIADFLQATGTSYSDLSVDLINDVVASAGGGSTSLSAVPTTPSFASPRVTPTQQPRTGGSPASVSPPRLTSAAPRSRSPGRPTIRHHRSKSVTMTPTRPTHRRSHTQSPQPHRLLQQVPLTTPKQQQRPQRVGTPTFNSSTPSTHRVSKSLRGSRSTPVTPDRTVSDSVRGTMQPAPFSNTPSKKKKKKRRGFLGFVNKGPSIEDESKIPGDIPLPPPIPPANQFVVNNSTRPTRTVPVSAAPEPPRPRRACGVCHRTTGSFIAALCQTFHRECFRCQGCNGIIDPNEPFRGQLHEGKQVPFHAACYAQHFAKRCNVCRKTLEAYVKHPFFEEYMCLDHADTTRVCTGCRRFEPRDAPFCDLGDGKRCVCPACFHSVVIDDIAVIPLWKRVLRYLEHELKLPIWKGMKDLSVLLVEASVLMEQRGRQQAPDQSTSLLSSGLCLCDYMQHKREFRLTRIHYNESSRSFSSGTRDSLASFDSQKGYAEVKLFAVICLIGLPKDLMLAVLAHEAMSAWIKMHPKYDPRKRMPPQVESGICQLVAMLFLQDGLDAPKRKFDDEDGPSDGKLRHYIRSTVERDNSEIQGAGYRKANAAYRDIGLDALLNHVMDYRQFPHT